MEKYNKYKDSGIDWIGKIPEHWEVKRVKDCASKVKAGKTPSTENGDYFSEGTENWFTPVDIKNNTINSSSRKVIKKSFSDNQISLFDKNSVYLIGIGDTLGNVAISNTKSSCNQQINVITFNEDISDPKFSFYQLIVIGNTLLRWCNYTTMPIFTKTATKQLELVLPPLKEQQQIANYLDTKTRVIDKKINLLEQKIVNYKAYRKTLINKTVKLKNSGINWIGKIPEHWEIKRIKDIFSISRGRVIGKTELKDKGKYPVYSSQTKNKGILGYIDTYDFNNNLLTWTTDGVNAGTVFKREGKFNCTNVCGTLIPKINPKLSLDYMAFAVQESIQYNKRIDTNGAKIMSNEMAVIDIVFPPVREQKKIAEYIKLKTTTIDKIVKNIETQRTVLKELRKTLINEVVTGKVKINA